MVDDILKEMSPRFAKLYADTGRPIDRIRWCCIDRLSWHDFSGRGFGQSIGLMGAPHPNVMGFIR